jgi:hypothetical protein
MMRELDTASPYRVQLNTSGHGYDMPKLDQGYQHERAAHELEKQKLADKAKQLIDSHALNVSKLEDRERQLQAYEQQMEIVKGAHEGHTAAEASHQESITAVTEKKKEAELAKQELQKQLRKLANFKQTANDVQPTRKQNLSENNTVALYSRRTTIDRDSTYTDSVSRTKAPNRTPTPYGGRGSSSFIV